VIEKSQSCTDNRWQEEVNPYDDGEWSAVNPKNKVWCRLHGCVSCNYTSPYRMAQYESDSGKNKRRSLSQSNWSCWLLFCGHDVIIKSQQQFI